MTDPRTEEIRARLEGVTPGPWDAVPEKDSLFYHSIYEQDYKGLLIARCNQRGQHHADAVFIAAARQDIPYLLDLIDAKDAEIAKLNDTVNWLFGLPKPTQDDVLATSSVSLGRIPGGCWLHASSHLPNE